VADLPRAVSAEVREAIVAAGKRCGFAYVALDLMGFRSGSLNEILHKPSASGQPLVTLRRKPS
jgi:PP-loop superfamily ATP-utilizing enzyme